MGRLRNWPGGVHARAAVGDRQARRDDARAARGHLEEVCQRTGLTSAELQRVVDRVEAEMPLPASERDDHVVGLLRRWCEAQADPDPGDRAVEDR